jgi:predicted adenylyl cyclase CyaB
VSFEVEIKVCLKQDLKTSKAKLETLGAKWQANIEHVDDYFLLPGGLRNFAKTDEALRVRATKKDGKFEAADFTYKGKKVGKVTKTREEIVVDVSSAEKMGEILQKIGLRKVYTLNKWREIFSCAFEGQDISITLDRVEHLDDRYMEVELQAKTQDEIKTNEEILLRFLGKLGYTKGDSLQVSYLELVLHKLNIKF